MAHVLLRRRMATRKIVRPRSCSSFWSWSLGGDKKRHIPQRMAALENELRRLQQENEGLQALKKDLKKEPEHPRKRVALLIDGDNISWRDVGLIVREAERHGIPTTKRVYGDFNAIRAKRWKEPILDFGMRPIQQFSMTAAKNSTDFAMIVDALDLLHSGKHDVFCIVTNDSDFTPLASRIRDNGKRVVAMGYGEHASSFLKATCDDFVTLEKFDINDISFVWDAISELTELEKTKDGWIDVGKINTHINEKHGELFKPQNFGHKGMLELLKTEFKDKLSFDKLGLSQNRIKQKA